MIPEPLTVLIVENNPHDAELVARITHEAFPEAGLLIINSGRAALTKLAYARFELILMDLKLDDMEGKQLVESVRTLAPASPIIMVSGDISLESAAASIAAGADSYLCKNDLAVSGLKRILTMVVARRKLLLEESKDRQDQLACELAQAEKNVAATNRNLARIEALLPETKPDHARR